MRVTSGTGRKDLLVRCHDYCLAGREGHFYSKAAATPAMSSLSPGRNQTRWLMQKEENPAAASKGNDSVLISSLVIGLGRAWVTLLADET